ncbi:MAG: FxsA protein [Halobacteriovoraceae bacterium]|nr:FxsA protein [Halobacteriovoraceae bacterium]|tara:strand:- start:12313 stop:12801 length:489 start_codon:yes stop_codon:yes gene_type:complete
MFAPLFLLFTVVPALELYLLFKVGGTIGGFNTILLIIATGIIGAALAKTQGLSILAKIQQQLNQGQVPADQIVQGLMVFAGGLLLLTPGIMTDILGFSLVLPGTRHILMIFVKQGLEQSIKNGNFQFQYASHSYSTQSSDFEAPREKPIQPGVFEAEYTEKD